MTTQFYLNLANGKNLPVELSAHNGQLTMRIIGTKRIVELALSGDFACLAGELSAAVAPHRKDYNGWDWLTPEYVIRYFEQSPVLREMAGDVRAVLGNQASQDRPHDDLRLQQDLEAIAHLESPSKADIAEALTGDRSYAGATYRRVKAVYDSLNSTTTTTPKERYLGGSNDLAA